MVKCRKIGRNKRSDCHTHYGGLGQVLTPDWIIVDTVSESGKLLVNGMVQWLRFQLILARLPQSRDGGRGHVGIFVFTYREPLQRSLTAMLPLLAPRNCSSVYELLRLHQLCPPKCLLQLDFRPRQL